MRASTTLRPLQWRSSIPRGSFAAYQGTLPTCTGTLSTCTGTTLGYDPDRFRQALILSSLNALFDAARCPEAAGLAELSCCRIVQLCVLCDVLAVPVRRSFETNTLLRLLCKLRPSEATVADLQWAQVLVALLGVMLFVLWGRQQRNSESPEPQDQEVQELAEQTDSDDPALAPPSLEGLPIRRQLGSAQFLFSAVFGIAHILRSNIFLGTMGDYLVSVLQVQSRR